jgi:uncharacterized protein HemX
MGLSDPRNGNRLTAAMGRLVLLLAPAIVAAVASYVAVASQLVRLEERLISIKQQMELRQSYVERDITTLQKTDTQLAAELAQLRKGD